MYADPKCWGEEAYSDICDWEYGGFTYRIYREALELKTMYGVLRRAAERTPGKVYLVDEWGHECTFAELLDHTERVAQYLYEEIGIRRGDHVGIMVYNSIEFCAVYYALSKLGAVLVSLPTKFKRDEVDSLVDKAGVRLIICNTKYEEWFGVYRESGVTVISIGDGARGYELVPYELEREEYFSCEAGPEDPAVIIFTSGTTSQSKGAVLRNFNILHAIISYQWILRLTPDDLTVTPAPMYHITGMIAVQSLFAYVGAKIFLQIKYDPARVADLIRTEKLTFIHATPTIFIMLLDQRREGEQLESITQLMAGSSSMPIEKIRELHDWMPNMAFRTTYGLTETTSVGVSFPGDAAVSPYIGSVGLPAPGLDVAVWDDNGNEVPDNTLGEIMFRGSAIITEYLNLDSKLIEDCWLHTGDIGYFNDDGYLWVVDRKKDMINYGGEKVPSFDIENAIYQLGGIREVAVIGGKDARYGEVVGAAISLKEGARWTAEQIREELRPRLAKFKIPREIRFMDEIPKTENNKINKKYIREKFNAEHNRKD